MAMTCVAVNMSLVFLLMIFILPGSAIVGNELPKGQSKSIQEKRTTDYLRGRKQAQRDVVKGKYVVKVFGYPPKEVQKQYTWIRRKYRIYIHGGCVFSKKDGEFAEGYNDVMDTAIKKRFGINFDEMLDATKQEIEASEKIIKCPEGEYAKIGKAGVPFCCPDEAICD